MFYPAIILSIIAAILSAICVVLIGISIISDIRKSKKQNKDEFKERVYEFDNTKITIQFDKDGVLIEEQQGNSN